MNKKKVLLLNPPAKGKPLRGGYCTNYSKGLYYWQPIDLIVLSGMLSEAFCVDVLDTIVENLDYKKSKKLILDNDYSAIIFLTNTVTWKDDFAFLQDIKKCQSDVTLISNGDILLFEGKRILKDFSFIDAYLLNFIEVGIVEFLEGRFSEARNIIYKKNGDLIDNTNISKQIEFSIPIPRHDLFSFEKYRIPTLKNKPMTTTLTSYGCPFKCNFCTFGTIDFKIRNIDNVINEMFFIKKIGIKEILFIEPSFGVIKSHYTKLLKEIIKSKLDLKWVCEARVDSMDAELLSLMKAAGCHCIWFGVESGNENILKNSSKGITKEKIKETFNLCKKFGIDAMAHFIIGLLGETRETVKETITFAKQLDCDFVSFNIAMPTVGTKIRQEAIERGYIINNSIEPITPSDFIMMGDDLDKRQIIDLQKKAFKNFYFRPQYILKRISKFTTFTEIKNTIEEALYLIKNSITGDL